MRDDPPIGERIRQLRNGLMTQQDLAVAADVSVDLVRKLEQGRRHTASVANLHNIARALDVDLGDLLSKTSPMPSADPDVGIVAIRRALTPVDDLLDDAASTAEPLSMSEAERTVDYLWGSYWAGRYELLASLLPNAVEQIRATYRHVDTATKPRASNALARTYQAAGDTLVHLGHPDAAFLAIREALNAAEKGDDPLLYEAVRVSTSWQLLTQGRFEDAERVALAAAGDLGTTGAKSSDELAAYGILAVTAATAGARSRKRGRTEELLHEAQRSAQHLGTDQFYHQTTFGPSKVAMLTTDCHVVMDNFPEALESAKALPRDTSLPLASRARHLADVAYSTMRLGHNERAVDTLLTIEQMAPDWIKYQRLPRQVTAELLETGQRARSPRLHELAQRLGVRHTF